MTGVPLKIPIISETRHLFEYFMMSESDVDIIKKLFLKLSNNQTSGVTPYALLKYLNLPNHSFFENFLNYFPNDNGLINFYVFVKFILISTFETTPLVIMNCFEYFLCNNNEDPISALEMLFSLYSESDLTSNLRLTISSMLLGYNFNYPKFFHEKEKDPLFIPFYYPFVEMLSSVRQKSYHTYIRNAIANKYIKCEQYLTYFRDNNSYPPLSFCQYVHVKLLKYPNPNKFDYCMDVQRRKYYQLPYIFVQSGVGTRSSMRRKDNDLNTSGNPSVLGQSIPLQKNTLSLLRNNSNNNRNSVSGNRNSITNPDSSSTDNQSKNLKYNKYIVYNNSCSTNMTNRSSQKINCNSIVLKYSLNNSIKYNNYMNNNITSSPGLNTKSQSNNRKTPTMSRIKQHPQCTSDNSA